MLLKTIEDFLQHLNMGILISTAHDDVVYVACYSSDHPQHSIHDLMEDSWCRCYSKREVIVNVKPAMRIDCQVRL